MRAAPAEGEDAVDELPDRGLRAIAHRRQVGDQADVPEQERDRAVDADREDVPQERAAEVGPRCPSGSGAGTSSRRPRRVPRGSPGTVRAHMTAKMVIASAERLIEVRHFWRKRKRIAEISVPAWPMPTQKTKFVMSHAQPTGTLRPQTPIPSQKSHETATPRRPRSARDRDEEEPPADRCRPLDRLRDDLGDRMEIGRAQDERLLSGDGVQVVGLGLHHPPATALRRRGAARPSLINEGTI